ncbi:MAG: helix-turn-helix domain-containing protein [Acidobacteria bacterium]|nr:helix-turn-helix domain-containing protein [Acidobacteriota bacterium]
MSTATDIQERFSYRPEEAAAALGCSRDTIFKLLASGDLKGWKINTARFISADEIRRFIREREHEAGPEPAGAEA